MNRKVLEFSWRNEKPRFLKPDFLESFKAKNYPLGFLAPPAPSVIGDIQRFVSAHSAIRNYCLVGIGGSATPVKALRQFFAGNASKSKVPGFWVLDSIDAGFFDSVMRALGGDLKHSLFHVVSKSGQTLEVELLRGKIEAQLKKSLPLIWNKHFVVTTTIGPSNPLEAWARKSKIPILNLPEDIGGRYSSFSAVTYLWASFLGLNLDDFGRGSRAILDNTQAPFLYAEKLAERVRARQNILGLFLYGEHLSALGDFLSQLFAESLGKEGKGLTPVPFLGTRDQHSLLQLFLDGPKDKVVTLIRDKRASSDGLSQALWASSEGVRLALKERGVPCFTIDVGEKSEFAYGALIQFFHLAVLGLGVLWRVNPFDQPMVELQKKYTRKLLRSA